MPKIRIPGINRVEKSTGQTTEIYRPPKVENLRPPENAGQENIPERGFGALNEHVEAANIDGAAPLSPTAATHPLEEKYKQIESVLEEDLGDLYFKLPPLKQREFKLKGEQTTLAILKILIKPKVNVKKIINLIKKWLAILPGVNKFFLEQIAKIKADRIMAAFGRDRRDGR